MKKLLFALFATLAVFTLWSCSDDDDSPSEKAIEYSQLPQAAKDFISRHYNVEEVMRIERDGDHDGSAFEVKFMNGSEVEFDAAGQWIDVDAPAGYPIPEGIAPQPIVNYVTNTFPEYSINEISRENYGYEIELTNGLDLKFDKDGIFIGHLD